MSYMFVYCSVVYTTDFISSTESDQLYDRILQEVKFESFTNTFDGIVWLSYYLWFQKCILPELQIMQNFLPRVVGMPVKKEKKLQILS